MCYSLLGRNFWSALSQKRCLLFYTFERPCKTPLKLERKSLSSLAFELHKRAQIGTFVSFLVRIIRKSPNFRTSPVESLIGDKSLRSPHACKYRTERTLASRKPLAPDRGDVTDSPKRQVLERREILEEEDEENLSLLLVVFGFKNV